MIFLIDYITSATFWAFMLWLAWSQYRGHNFNVRSFIALFLGIGLGCAFKSVILRYHVVHLPYLESALSFVANAYIDLLKMLIVPLIITSIINAVANLRQHQGRYLTEISLKSVAILLIMTAISAWIGFAIAAWMHLGEDLNLSGHVLNMPVVHQDLAQTFLSMLPSNPIKAMAANNVIAVVVFALFLGVAVIQAHRLDKAKTDAFVGFIESAFHVVKRLAAMVISLTPYGVLALLIEMVMQQGLSTLMEMIHYVGAIYLAMLFVLGMHFLILLYFKVTPARYLKNVWRALFVAFTTRSSFGTLPVTMSSLSDRMKVAPSVANFVPGIGATLGMNACAGIFPAMVVVMTLNYIGQPITFEIFLLVGLFNMIASLGLSGLPGTAYVAAGVTLSSLGLPFTLIPLVQGVDPIVDMGRTMTNINGVMTTAIAVDKTTWE